MAKTETKKLSVTLDQENMKRWQRIKDHYGLKFNQSLVTLLLSHESSRLRQEGC